MSSMLLSLAGSVVGQLLHIVKKKSEETGKSEGAVFKRWIVKRPVRTLASLLIGLGVSSGGALLTAPVAATGEWGWLVVLAQSVVTGFASNSGINRPGEKG